MSGGGAASADELKAGVKVSKVAHAGEAELSEADPELFALMQREKLRQVEGIELIASENFTSRAVTQALGSCLTNKYSEGYPGRRYYGGNEVIDDIERLCQRRALAAYGVSADEWGVNVQPYSGSPANFAVLTGLLDVHDRIMGLGLQCGGHLTHGYMTPTGRKLSASSIYFESLAYYTDEATGLIAYDQLARDAAHFRPKLLWAGASAYPRDWDYARMRQIADSVGAVLVVDMAHVSGLVAAGEQASPFAHADVVTTTTHKSLRGPRAGMIFYRRGTREYTAPNGKKRTVDYGPFKAKIDEAVFPGLQGGPHEHQVAAVATALREAAAPEFKEYQKAVRANAVRCADELAKLGHTIVTGGTENHIVLWDVRPLGLTGSKLETLLEAAHVSVNKNMVPGDKNALSPGGVRLGTGAMTTRGVDADGFARIAALLDRAAKLAKKLQDAAGSTKLDAFRAQLTGEHKAEVDALRDDVHAFARQYGMPGLDDH